MQEIKLHAEATAWLQKNEEAIEFVTGEVFAELARAAVKHGDLPGDIIHRAAIVGEESGELLRACVNFKYETGLVYTEEEAAAEVYKEALHTAATAIKFLLSLKTQPI